MAAALPPVHAANPAFVTFGDNAECGAHCAFTAVTNGVATDTRSSDQWGVWGTSAALVVTTGDLLVVELVNFCIPAGSVTSCDITAFSDKLGNTFTNANIGTATVLQTGNPVEAVSVFYTVATNAGTEAATNAFTVSISCAGCVITDTWDTEYLIYEYSNAIRVSQGNVVQSFGGSIVTLNAPITVTAAGDTIYGFAWGASTLRPINYASSQTNQHSWAGSNGYPAGDLEGLAAGSNNYKMSDSAAGSGTDGFILVTADVTNQAAPSAATPTPGTSQGVGPDYSWIAWISIPGIFLLAVVAVAIKRK